VNPVALGEDEPAHLGIPSASLVSEVDTGLEELLETGLHWLWDLDWVSRPLPSASPSTGRARPRGDSGSVFGCELLSALDRLMADG